MIKKKRKKKTHPQFFDTTPPPPPPENRAVYEKMWEKFGMAGQVKDDNIIRRMRIARCIPKATDTHNV